MHLPVSGIKFFAPLALFVSLLLPVAGLAFVPSEVTVNKSVLMNLQKPLQRVSIANPAIAELIVISPTELQINGTRIGTTSLIVWEKGGGTTFFDVRVKGDSSLLESKINEIAPHDSITVDYANDTIVLSGKATNDQTIKKVVQIAKAYAGTLDADAEKETAPQVQLSRDYGNGLPRAAEPKESGKVRVLNQIEVDDPQQVLLEVKVAQVDKNALRSLGISMLAKGSSAEGFSNLVGAPDVPLQAGQTPGIAGDIPRIGLIGPLANYQLGGSFFRAGLGVALKALATRNLARMLAEPNLLVKSGKQGRFLAGSKIPIQVVTGVGAISGTTIEYIDVGVKLNFKPVVLENGLISLTIDPAEVSSISGNLAVNGYPIIDTREIRTDVQLRDGESLVLAGLLQEETIKTMSKIPLLGDIPILGALFRSTQDDLRQKELVFFITPKINVPLPAGTEPELPTDQTLNPEQQKEYQWMPLGD